MKTDKTQIVNEVFALYEKYGNQDYIGEPVSQLEHMSQSAQLAIEEGYDDEVVVAAFFHDIGHICVMHNKEKTMESYGIKSHEKIGADFLRSKGFPESIATLVENHVQAKRYLTYKHPEYYNNLSDASKATLKFQGGPMSFEEAVLFERHPLFEVSIQMRKWDELAKDTAKNIIDLNEMKERVKHILDENQIQ